MTLQIKILLALLYSPMLLFGQVTTESSYQRGLVLLRSGQLIKAKESFSLAIKSNPNDVNSYFNRGITNYQLKDSSAACLDWNYASLACDSEALELIHSRCNATFSIVKDMPSFPGGEVKLIEFIRSNVKYPDEARQKKISGIVFVTIIVNQSGIIEDVKVIKGTGFGLDEEAIRVIKLMPNWIPGKQCNQTVKVRYNIPINFRF